MEIILKKTQWFTVITILCIVVVSLFAAAGCDKAETPPTVCNFDNPLTDLPWLKEKTDEFNLLTQENQSLSIAIFKCNYGDEETGFLVDEGNAKPFYNCNGKLLCTMDVDAEKTCSELYITCKERILKITNNDIKNSCEVENPLTDLLWLKSEVDELTLIIQSGRPIRASIYQCNYGNNETGFLEFVGYSSPFYNCNGEILCIMGGDAGETCPELNIVSEELIWEMNEIDNKKPKK